MTNNFMSFHTGTLSVKWKVVILKENSLPVSKKFRPLHPNVPDFSKTFLWEQFKDSVFWYFQSGLKFKIVWPTNKKTVKMNHIHQRTRCDVCVMFQPKWTKKDVADKAASTYLLMRSTNVLPSIYVPIYGFSIHI